MTKEEQAKIILKHLEKYISVDSAYEKFYLKGIVNGLVEIEKRDK